MSRSATPDRFGAALIAWSVAVVLAALLYRHGRLLTFDGYHYCEFAKLYTTSWPPAFGNHWPSGYPLLGGLLGRAGLPAYEALCLVSLIALTVLVALADTMARQLPRPALVLSALAATPVVGIQLFGNLTELPFAAALLGVAAALAAPRKHSGWWAAATFALVALSLRYAGVTAFAVLWFWLAVHSRELRRKSTLGTALVAVGCSTLAAAGLLLWNLRATGFLSGAPRDAADHVGLIAWPRHLADLGWSPAFALLLGGLRNVAGGDRLAALLAGWTLSLIGLAVCLQAWIKPRFPWVRSLALVAFAYGAGMTVLRSVGTFDSLYNARVFLPALFPFGLLAAAQFSSRWPRLVAGGFAVLLAAGVVSAIRGLSLEIGGDVRAAVPLLRERLRPDDGIQINDHAFSLAAYLPERTFRVWPESWQDGQAQRYLVIAAATVDRRGTPGPLDPPWLAFAAQLVARGTHRRLLESPSLLVLEHTEPNPSR